MQKYRRRGSTIVAVGQTSGGRRGSTILAGAVAAAATASSTRANLSEVYDDRGYLHCPLCQKHADESHLESAGHRYRVENICWYKHYVLPK